jgi:hypothetical protein
MWWKLLCAGIVITMRCHCLYAYSIVRQPCRFEGSTVKMLTWLQEKPLAYSSYFSCFIIRETRKIYLDFYSSLLKCHKLIRQSKNLDIYSLCLVAWNLLCLYHIPTILYVLLLFGWFIHIFSWVVFIYTTHAFAGNEGFLTVGKLH